MPSNPLFNAVFDDDAEEWDQLAIAWLNTRAIGDPLFGDSRAFEEAAYRRYRVEPDLAVQRLLGVNERLDQHDAFIRRDEAVRATMVVVAVTAALKDKSSLEETEHATPTDLLDTDSTNRLTRELYAAVGPEIGEYVAKELQAYRAIELPLLSKTSALDLSTDAELRERSRAFGPTRILPFVLDPLDVGFEESDIMPTPDFEGAWTDLPPELTALLDQATKRFGSKTPLSKVLTKWLRLHDSLQNEQRQDFSYDQLSRKLAKRIDPINSSLDDVLDHPKRTRRLLRRHDLPKQADTIRQGERVYKSLSRSNGFVINREAAEEVLEFFTNSSLLLCAARSREPTPFEKMLPPGSVNTAIKEYFVGAFGIEPNFRPNHYAEARLESLRVMTVAHQKQHRLLRGMTNLAQIISVSGPIFAFSLAQVASFDLPTAAIVAAPTVVGGMVATRITRRGAHEEATRVAELQSEKEAVGRTLERERALTRSIERQSIETEKSALPPATVRSPRHEFCDRSHTRAERDGGSWGFSL